MILRGITKSEEEVISELRSRVEPKTNLVTVKRSCKYAEMRLET
jgi:hypothetical protein